MARGIVSEVAAMILSAVMSTVNTMMFFSQNFIVSDDGNANDVADQMRKIC